ncbi:MAG: hypothetical protein WAV07_17415 [Candidatus Contendobacter sp.]
MAPLSGKTMVESGIILLKYYHFDEDVTLARIPDSQGLGGASGAKAPD